MTQPLAKRPVITYADAGVDIDRANRAKQRIKLLARRTFTRGVLSEIGGFGGLFAVDRRRYRDPVLVSSVDGVGTKLKVAFATAHYHTVGADLVNHCVNDIA
ncbi:MAG: phosphoribosylformylglycinamidine cyclo-ligase, partial [Terriglobales bacterium]